MSELGRIVGLRAASIGEAAAYLPKDEPLSHLFYEEREDVERTVSSGGAREERRRRTFGSAAVGRITTHLSEPGRGDFIRLAKSAGDPTISLDRADVPEENVLDHVTQTGHGLEELEEWLGSSPLPGSTTVQVREISQCQCVWVARPGEPSAFDMRSGRRLEVRVGFTAGGDRVEAVGERVLKASDPLPHHLVEDTIERARQRAEDSPIVGGMWNDTMAVFAPGTAGVLVHELIGHALEGDVVGEGRSWLARSNEFALPRLLTVVDDPRQARVAWRVDDEGTPSATLRLVESGRVVAHLHDRRSASGARCSSTGHARRGSYLGRILPRLGCTYIERGSTRGLSILEDTANGIYVRRLVAGTATPDRGTATFLVTDADRIERGRLSSPLPAFPMFVDLRRHLSSLDAIGDDLAFDSCTGTCVRDGQPIAASVGAPTIRLGVITAWM